MILCIHPTATSLVPSVTGLTQCKLVSGKSEGLLPLRPLRTVQASLQAHGSINNTQHFT